VSHILAAGSHSGWPWHRCFRGRRTGPCFRTSSCWST
jgi:hypothetical protein